MSDKYNSKIAQLIGRLNGVEPPRGYAVTISAYTTLYSLPKEQVIPQTEWVAEEDYHQAQFKRDGWIPFVCFYFWQMLYRGYKRNKLEIEAKRAAGRI